MAYISTLFKTSLLLLWFLFACITKVSCQPGIFNVMNFGAKADNIADDAPAFVAAWAQACGAPTKSIVSVPPGTYLAGPVLFKGPCKSPVEIQLEGTVKAPIEMTGQEDWITFCYVTGLTLTGKGAFDGQGAAAWKANQCANKDQGGACKFPVNIRFNFVTDAVVCGISSIDSKFFHVNLLGCKNIKFQGVKIQAPAESLNTDGIHMGDSNGVEICDTTIGTGDDCISIGSGIENLNIQGVTCGPGHGISIGSLGKCDKPETVNGVFVKNCTFCNTDNGVRIKTWPAGNAGTVNNVTFEDITVNDVKNPIVIDQEYCPYNKCDKSAPSQIKITKAIFKNIHGTSATKEAVTLVCGQPCDGVELTDINLMYTGPDGPPVSRCCNVKPVVALNTVPPMCPPPAI